MNRLLLMIGLLFILIMPQAWGQTTSQYPSPYRQTMWNNVTDKMHTLGQNPQQAKATLTQLHNKRTWTRKQSIVKAVKAKRQAWAQS